MKSVSQKADVIRRRSTCRACGSSGLDLVFRLNPSPIGDAYVTAKELAQPQPTYPIDLHLCRECGLAQLLDVIDPEILYGSYIYVTGSSVGLQEHFAGYVDEVIRRCGLDRGSLVIDIGSNDGTLLQAFKKRGMRVLGIEPASHIAAEARAAGIDTIDEFFDAELAQRVVHEHGRPKLVTANNVFANIDDLGTWVAGIERLLAEDGVFVFESFYLADVLENMVFDFIYHEHLSAFSVKPMRLLFKKIGLELAAVERVPTKGGSLRYFVQRPGGPVKNDGSVESLEGAEEANGLYRKGTYDAYTAKVDRLREATVDCLAKLKTQGKSVAGFGASITGTTLIYHFDIGSYLDYLIDDNPAKQGRFSPGLHLPVLPTSVLSERKPDYVVALAWRFVKPFVEKNRAYLRDGGRVIVPVPEFKVIGEA